MPTNKIEEDAQVMLSPHQLSIRHQVSEKKLANDRLAGRGVRYCKIGRLCRYPLYEVLKYEEMQLRRSTSDIGGSDV